MQTQNKKMPLLHVCRYISAYKDANTLLLCLTFVDTVQLHNCLYPSLLLCQLLSTPNQFLTCSKMYTLGDTPLAPFSGEYHIEMKTARSQAAFCAYSWSVLRGYRVSRPVGAAAVLVGRHGLGLPVHHSRLLEVKLASKVMPSLKETCYEICGWNNSGANTTCALVEKCLLLHCQPCKMVQILGLGPCSVCCLDSRERLPVRGASGCSAASTPPMLRHSKYQHQQILCLFWSTDLYHHI